MFVRYALQPHPKSIFLAGPTPRPPRDGAAPIVSWRIEAIAILEEIGFDGEVIVPEIDNWAQHDNYDAQVEWEWEGIDRATIVAFWVPRVIDTMPAFTINVELGLLASSGRVVFGCPPDSPKNTYPQAVCERFHIPVESTLEGTLRRAVKETTRRLL